VKKKEEENEVAVITCSAFLLLSSYHHVKFQNYYMTGPCNIIVYISRFYWGNLQKGKQPIWAKSTKP